MTLDMTGTQARQACLRMDGLFREPAFCRPTSAQPSLISREASPLYAVDLGFDPFGHAKRIKAIYGGDSALLAEQLKSAVEQITAILGDPRSGELGWCARAGNCSGTSRTEWAFEGGAVSLAAEVSEHSLELELTHSHDDMSEHVIYGLPVCG